MCLLPSLVSLLSLALLLGALLLMAYEQRSSLCSCRLRGADARWRDFTCNWLDCLLADLAERAGARL